MKYVRSGLIKITEISSPFALERSPYTTKHDTILFLGERVVIWPVAIKTQLESVEITEKRPIL